MVLVFHSVLTGNITPHQQSRWLAELPEAKREMLLRVRHLETRNLSLLGYQLVKRACTELGSTTCQLAHLVFPRGGKPVFRHGIHFSLTHSHRLVVCAASGETPLGLDTEYVRSIDGERLRNTLSDGERAAITEDQRCFFDIWTGKEAIIKAQGRTGIAQMKNIDLSRGNDNDPVSFDKQQWYLTRLRIQPGYVTHLATHQAMPGIRQQMVHWHEL